MERKRVLLYCLASAVLLSLPWYGVTGMTLPVALVPLLMVSEGYPAGRRGFRAMIKWAGGTMAVWAAATTWWVVYAAWIGAVMSVIISFTLFDGILVAYHWASKRVPRYVAYILLIAGWISMELLYTNGELSFPWLTLGNGFASDIALVQWYDTTGVFGGSLWVLLANVLFFEAWRRKNKRTAIAGLAAVLIPVCVSLVKYYTYREQGRPVVITAVQPNINPYTTRIRLSPEEQTDLMLRLAGQAPRDASFVIFPESAVYETVVENSFEQDRNIRKFTRFIAAAYPNTMFITGASTRYYYMPGEKLSPTVRYDGRNDLYYDFYNTAIAMDSSGVVDVYHKARLVVGAERMPFFNLLKKMDFLVVDLGGVTGQLGYDPDRKVFTSDGVGIGAAICWEGVFGQYYSGFVKEGADVMAIISNDGWWENTQGHKQLFRLSQLRAIESRRAIARSANTGVSGFINQRGNAIEKVGWDVRAAVTATILTNDKLTFYTRYGDYIARISVLVFGLCVLYIIAYRVRKRDHLPV